MLPSYLRGEVLAVAVQLGEDQLQHVLHEKGDRHPQQKQVRAGNSAGGVESTKAAALSLGVDKQHDLKCS